MHTGHSWVLPPRGSRCAAGGAAGSGRRLAALWARCTATSTACASARWNESTSLSGLQATQVCTRASPWLPEEGNSGQPTLWARPGVLKAARRSWLSCCWSHASSGQHSKPLSAREPKQPKHKAQPPVRQWPVKRTTAWCMSSCCGPKGSPQPTRTRPLASLIPLTSAVLPFSSRAWRGGTRATPASAGSERPAPQRQPGVSDNQAAGAWRTPCPGLRS